MGDHGAVLTSVGDVYAKALLRAAGDRARQDEVGAELAELVEYMAAHSEFAAFMTASSVDDEPRRASLERLFRGRMGDLLLNLLQVLNNRGRSALIVPVHQCVQRRLQALHHQQEVRVESAAPLNDDLRVAIRRELAGRLDKQPVLVESVRPELLGGMVLRIGDVEIDGSVAGRMNLLRRRLLERAGEEVHRSGEYVNNE